MKRANRSLSARNASMGAVALLAAALVCLGACAPGRAADDGGGAVKGNAPVVDAAWSLDADCGTCHATEQASYDSPACEASLHKGTNCAQCHTDESTLAMVHEGKTATGKTPTRLKKTSVEDDLCLRCHFDSREGLIAATDGKAVLTDSEGTQRNPHDPQGVAEHEGIACGDCHNMHSDENVQDRAMNECTSCHHEGVFACYTCHD